MRKSIVTATILLISATPALAYTQRVCHGTGR